MKAFCKLMLKTCLFLIKTGSFTKAYWLSLSGAPLNGSSLSCEDIRSIHENRIPWADLKIEKERIFSKSLHGTIKNKRIVFPKYRKLVELATGGWRLNYQGDKIQIQNSSQGTRLWITNTEEVEMAHEIFNKKCYNLKPSGPTLVLDVGGNVGMAAIFFSQDPHVKKIHTFEPFLPTSRQMEQNLKLNRHTAKIRIHRIGLGKTSRNLRIKYDARFKGSMTTAGLAVWRKAKGTQLSEERIQIREASPVIKKILSKTRVSVICKMDCEGSELGILENLEDKKILKRIDVFVIEWHGSLFRSVLRILERNAYMTFIGPSDNPKSNLGLVYAFKK